MTALTIEKIESVVDKLNDFADGLPADEQQALAWVIAHAETGDGDDVSGYLGTLSGGAATTSPQLVVRPKTPGPADHEGIIAILIG